MSEVLSLLNQNIQNAFNPKYSLLTRIDCLWAVFQFFSFFPMFLCTLHRFYNQIPHTPYIKDKKMKFPTNIVEYFVKFNTFMFVIFYIPQTILRFFIPKNLNNILLIIHHLATFYGAYVFIRIEYYPWFTLGPLAFHSLLLAMPTSTILYYPYIILILMCCHGVSIEPYKSRKGYKEIITYIIQLSIVLVIMWAVGFTNEIELVSYLNN